MLSKDVDLDALLLSSNHWMRSKYVDLDAYIFVIGYGEWHRQKPPRPKRYHLLLVSKRLWTSCQRTSVRVDLFFFCLTLLANDLVMTRLLSGIPWELWMFVVVRCLTCRDRGIKTGFYHGSLSKEQRNYIQVGIRLVSFQAPFVCPLIISAFPIFFFFLILAEWVE